MRAVTADDVRRFAAENLPAPTTAPCSPTCRGDADLMPAEPWIGSRPPSPGSLRPFHLPEVVVATGRGNSTSGSFRTGGFPW
jgi:hypothetical protein